MYIFEVVITIQSQKAKVEKHVYIYIYLSQFSICDFCVWLT